MASSDLVVVVGVDDTESSELAFSKALKILSPNAFYHIAIHGIEPDAVTIKNAVMEHVNKEKVDKEKSEKEAALLKLADKFKLLASTAGLKSKVVGLSGDLDVALCTYCQVVNADVLFLPSHLGETRPFLLMGKVSSYCVEHAGCTVVVESDSQKKSALAKAAESTTAAAKSAADGITGAAKGAAAGMAGMTDKVKSLFTGSKEEKAAEESK